MPYVIMWLLGVPLTVVLLLWVVGIGRSVSYSSHAQVLLEDR